MSCSTWACCTPFCACVFCCACKQRKEALHGDLTRYRCCQDRYCQGERYACSCIDTGLEKCESSPQLGLCCEVVCCTYCAVYVPPSLRSASRRLSQPRCAAMPIPACLQPASLQFRVAQPKQTTTHTHKPPPWPLVLPIVVICCCCCRCRCRRYSTREHVWDEKGMVTDPCDIRLLRWENCTVNIACVNSPPFDSHAPWVASRTAALLRRRRRRWFFSPFVCLHTKAGHVQR